MMNKFALKNLHSSFLARVEMSTVYDVGTSILPSRLLAGITSWTRKVGTQRIVTNKLTQANIFLKRTPNFVSSGEIQKTRPCKLRFHHFIVCLSHCSPPNHSHGNNCIQRRGVQCDAWGSVESKEHRPKIAKKIQTIIYLVENEIQRKGCGEGGGCDEM